MARSALSLVRLPLLLLALMALAAVLLLQVERTGGTGPAPLVGGTVGISHKTSHEPKQTPPKHCTDGKGKDAQKNKHCQISQG